MERTALARILTENVRLEYSIPGNTYSSGKTDFWDYVADIFGISLPPDTGLTGKRLKGAFDPSAGYLTARGIPLMPFTDAYPEMEDPYQQALVILRNSKGQELVRSTPVLPVSVEMNCVGSGCHQNETEIVNSHVGIEGYDPADTPIFCAECHADPFLGAPGKPEAGYLSYQIHKTHAFVEDKNPIGESCYTCHPGPNARFLRGAMGDGLEMVCQHCHGGMEEVSDSILEGRKPWVNQPSCQLCHIPPHDEMRGDCDCFFTGGHYGVMCGACHNSVHAIYPSREVHENDNMIALQGHAGTLSDCSVCHYPAPADGDTAHGQMSTREVMAAIMHGAERLSISPGVFTPPAECRIEVQPVTGGGKNQLRNVTAARRRGPLGRMIVFDSRGHTLRMLSIQRDSGGLVRSSWDGLDSRGNPVAPGDYFIRWQDGDDSFAGSVIVAGGVE